MTQPQPLKNDRPYVVEEVVEDLRQRKRVGIRKYGTALQPFNGRDALVDAYEEVLDLSQYLKQELLERNTDRFHKLWEHERCRNHYLKRNARILWAMVVLEAIALIIVINL